MKTKTGSRPIAGTQTLRGSYQKTNAIKGKSFSPTRGMSAGKITKQIQAENIFNEDAESLKMEMIDRERAIQLFSKIKQIKQEFNPS